MPFASFPKWLCSVALYLFARYDSPICLVLYPHCKSGPGKRITLWRHPSSRQDWNGNGGTRFECSATSTTSPSQLFRNSQQPWQSALRWKRKSSLLSVHRFTQSCAQLPYQAGWQDLKDLFRSAGNIIRADINIGADGRPKGSGTVVFETAADAKQAISTWV